MESHFPGMDYDFLRYMGVLPENQRRIQSHYLPYFEGCSRVVDLACGDADFVELLVERGVDVVGVDSDDKAFAATSAKGLPVVKQDVFAWLAEQPDASFDGVFSAHLIEHLPYPKAVEMIDQSYRILRPGGVILIVTPNARSLFSHLEMFYTHFGHVTFYHPRLVNFFLDRAGFVDLHESENPITASPLLPRIREFIAESLPGLAVRQDEQKPDLITPAVPEAGRGFSTASTEQEAPVPVEILYQNEVPLQGRMPWHYLSYWTKRMLSSVLVRPLTDSLAENVRRQARTLQEQLTKIEERNQEQARLIEHFFQRQISAQQETIVQLFGLLAQEQSLRRDQVARLEEIGGELHSHLHIFARDIQQLNGAFEAFNWAYKSQVDAQTPVEAPEQTESVTGVLGYDEEQQ